MLPDIYRRSVSALVLFLIVAAILFAYKFGIIGKWIFGAIAILLGTMAVSEWSYICLKKKKYPIFAFGFLYILLGSCGLFKMMYFLNIRIAAFAIATAVISDVMAYVAGSIIGGKKLVPSISPNKTWAGALAALIVSPLIGVSFFFIFEIMPLRACIFLSTGMCAAAISGDIIESFAKRLLSIKDMGSIIPGHGGVLDRIDSWLAIGIVALIFIPINALELQQNMNYALVSKSGYVTEPVIKILKMTGVYIKNHPSEKVHGFQFVANSSHIDDVLPIIQGKKYRFTMRRVEKNVPKNILRGIRLINDAAVRDYVMGLVREKYNGYTWFFMQERWAMQNPCLISQEQISDILDVCNNELHLLDGVPCPKANYDGFLLMGATARTVFARITFLNGIVEDLVRRKKKLPVVFLLTGKRNLLESEIKEFSLPYNIKDEGKMMIFMMQKFGHKAIKNNFIFIYSDPENGRDRATTASTTEAWIAQQKKLGYSVSGKRFLVVSSAPGIGLQRQLVANVCTDRCKGTSIIIDAAGGPVSFKNENEKNNMSRILDTISKILYTMKKGRLVKRAEPCN